MTSYQDLIDDAMLGIVRKVLSRVQTDGMDDDKSFYISFRTNFPGVVLSKHVRSKYPQEITVVLQYQFRDLHVSEDEFSVNIAFGGIPENIHVPFSSLTSFVDPAENFSLQFRRELDIFEDEEITDLESDDAVATHVHFDRLKSAEKSKKTTNAKKQKSGEVIALDKFRDKKK